MKIILEHLTKTLEAVQHKHQEQSLNEGVLKEREDSLDAREKELSEKEANFASRESAVAGVERTEEFIRQTDELKRVNEEEKSRLAADRISFDEFKRIEGQKLSDAKKSIDDGWVAINKKSADIEAEVTRRVQDFIGKLDKKG